MTKYPTAYDLLIEHINIDKEIRKRKIVIKKYWANIDVKNPKTYFENWYSNMWETEIGVPLIEHIPFQKIFTDELAKIGAILGPYDNEAYYYITFENEKDYISFFNKWSS